MAKPVPAAPLWRTIGVVGGMGPAATADFLARLVAGAGAVRDSDHPHVLVDSNPHVPDRNAALAGGPSPGPVLAGMAQRLVASGAQVLAMPCNAAHGWADAVRAVPGGQFVDMIDAALAQAQSQSMQS
uniref:aspartate/glutamate racemase family protein n=1 Tax=Sandarakinorhabdus sp. TaxID=1916663 RepID=UPI00286E9C40